MRNGDIDPAELLLGIDTLAIDRLIARGRATSAAWDRGCSLSGIEPHTAGLTPAETTFDLSSPSVGCIEEAASPLLSPGPSTLVFSEPPCACDSDLSSSEDEIGYARVTRKLRSVGKGKASHARFATAKTAIGVRVRRKRCW